MASQIPKLEDQLCFPLYATAKEVVGCCKPLLDEIDLTYTQYLVMMVLWEYRSIGMRALGKRLYLDSGTLTPLLKRLEGKGLVQRARSTDDEREVIVTITEAGEELEAGAASISARTKAYLPLSPEETETLRTLLYKLLRQMDCGGRV